MRASHSKKLKTKGNRVNHEKMSPAERDAWLNEGLEDAIRAAKNEDPVVTLANADEAHIIGGVGEIYLAERGVTTTTAQEHGIEIEPKPTAERFRQRL